MEFPEPVLLDEELENQCNEIRAIASKNWLSSTHSSLQHLDKIKTSIYNVGIHDPKELKATNLSSRGQRSQSFTDLAVDPNAPPLSLQQNAIAWGSNASIPDLLAQHSARSQTNEKLSSRRTRPSSGKKLRPQSAKESGSGKGSQLPPKAPSIGVKGARVDPTGRPPKFVPHTSTGWVGPPAGLKFADDFQTDIPNDKTTTGSSTPPVPAGTPIPSEYRFDHGDSVLGDHHNDRNGVKTPEPPKPPSPELIHFSLPRMEDDYDEEDSDLDTERLLSKAEMHAPSPAGFNYTHSTSHNSSSGRLQASSQEDDFKDVTIPAEPNNKNTVSDKFDLVDDENDDLEDDWDEELADLHHEESLPFVVPNEKTSVKFREDKNVTIDITPRNLGYKVADLDFHTKKKHISPKDDELQSFLSVRSTCPTKNHLTEGNHGNKHTAELKSSQQSYTNSKKPRPLSSVLKNRTEVQDTKCEKRLTQERPKSANKPSTPVAMVTVAYSDTEDVKKLPKSKSRKKNSEKDVITMVQTVQSESEGEEDRKREDGSEDKITPDKLESWMPTKCVSDPPKNYYELSRRSASVQSHVREASPPSSSHVYKTTKTIEFDEYKPKETSIKSVIDNSTLLKSRDKERFVGLEEGGRPRFRLSSEHPPHLTPKDRPANRPRSAMIQKTKSNTDMEHSFSKGALVTAHAEKTGAKRMLRRPLSAPSQRKALEFLEKEENKRNEGAQENQNISIDTKPVLSEKEKEIENLINKHLRRNNSASLSSKPMVPESVQSKPEEPEMALPAEEMNVDVKEVTNNTQSEAEKVIETSIPSSASKPKTVSKKTKKNYEDIETLASGKCQHLESSKENKANRMVLKMAETQVNAKLSDNTRHYASYSRSRVRSAPTRRVSSEPKVRYTKPLYIHSKIPDDDVFTENEIEAHLIHERLAADSVYIRPETLERALYPPSGKTLYYDIENKLPRSTSASLLSHPKVWLPVEYKQFKLAEKNLNRANEIIRRQELAEERKARLAELGSVAKKKKGKKGKKKGVGKKKGETTAKKKSIC